MTKLGAAKLAFTKPVVTSLAASEPARLAEDASPALVAAAREAESAGRRDDARSLYERALHAIRTPDEGMTASAIVRWVSRTYAADADFDAALDCYELALALAELQGDPSEISHALNLQGAAYVQMGRLDDAEALFTLARVHARDAGDAKLSAMLAQNLGTISNVRGDLRAALQCYESSLADYRAAGDEHDVVGALNNLGMLYTDLHRWSEAERSLAEALERSVTTGNTAAQATVEANRAELFIAQRRFDEASASCDAALLLAKQLGDERSQGEVYKHYGVIARETGAIDVAEAHLARAAAVAEERQDPLLAAETAREQAELYRRQSRNRESLQYLNRAHRLFAELRARLDVADVDRRIGGLEAQFLEIVRRWGDSIESKDHYTRGHCERVTGHALALASQLGMDSSTLFWFRIGALLHDVGKLIVPPEILNKAGPLTPDEWTIIKRHPAAGVEMLADIDFPWDVRPMVLSHHERWDGGGYPNGLAGEEIPFPARVLCVADVYDALTSERSYKRAFSHAQAMSILREESGRHFDPYIFEQFERMMDAGVVGWAAGS